MSVLFYICSLFYIHCISKHFPICVCLLSTGTNTVGAPTVSYYWRNLSPGPSYLPQYGVVFIQSVLCNYHLKKSFIIIMEIPSISILHRHIFWYGSIFSHCFGHSVGPFHLEAHVLQFCEIYFNYFINNFLLYTSLFVSRAPTSRPLDHLNCSSNLIFSCLFHFSF